MLFHISKENTYNYSDVATAESTGEGKKKKKAKEKEKGLFECHSVMQLPLQ